jgi:hypothetical protein
MPNFKQNQARMDKQREATQHVLKTEKRGLTFLSAVKAGVPFRRSGATNWLYITPQGYLEYGDNDESIDAILSVTDYLARDWEIKKN